RALSESFVLACVNSEPFRRWRQLPELGSSSCPRQLVNFVDRHAGGDACSATRCALDSQNATQTFDPFPHALETEVAFLRASRTFHVEALSIILDRDGNAVISKSNAHNNFTRGGMFERVGQRFLDQQQ